MKPAEPKKEVKKPAAKKPEMKKRDPYPPQYPEYPQYPQYDSYYPQYHKVQDPVNDPYPTQWEDRTLTDWNRSAPKVELLDLATIVPQLNDINEDDVAQARQWTAWAISDARDASRQAVSDRVDAFEAQILSLRNDIQMYRDDKRAKTADANDRIRQTVADMLAAQAAEVDAMNEAQRDLLNSLLACQDNYGEGDECVLDILGDRADGLDLTGVSVYPELQEWDRSDAKDEDVKYKRYDNIAYQQYSRYY